MKEQFCGYKISLKLKQLGFDDECLAWYKNDLTLQHQFDFEDSIFTIQNSKSTIKAKCTAPLWQQAISYCLKRLESTNPEPYNRKWSIGYYADGSGAIDFGDGDYYFEFKTLEEAVLKLIELCQKQN